MAGLLLSEEWEEGMVNSSADHERRSPRMQLIMFRALWASKIISVSLTANPQGCGNDCPSPFPPWRTLDVKYPRQRLRPGRQTASAMATPNRDLAPDRDLATLRYAARANDLRRCRKWGWGPAKPWGRRATSDQTKMRSRPAKIRSEQGPDVKAPIVRRERWAQAERQARPRRCLPSLAT